MEMSETKTKNDPSATIACLDQIIESILYRIKEIDKEVPYLRKTLEEGAGWQIYELDTKTELETELECFLEEKRILKLIIKGEYGKNGNVSYLRSEDEDER